jgi:putative aldouronate transport system permease protein
VKKVATAPIVSGIQHNKLKTKSIIRKKSFLEQLNESKYLLLIFMPCFLYFIVFKYAPMFGIIISFKNYNIFKGVWDSPWVGLKYYKMFFANPDSFAIIKNTVLLGIYKLFWEFPAPILFALILNEVKNAYFKKTVQTISYLPHFISTVIVASMVLEFLSPRSGFINTILTSFGREPINFMADPGWFRTVYIVSDIWQQLGWGTIIYLAALTGISPELYEAADMDGASKLGQVWYVTLPCLAPTIITMFILNTGKVLEIGFEKVFLLYNPAIYETADVISTYVYRVGLQNGNFSYATAINLSMSIVSLILICSTNYLSKKLSETSIW